MLLAYRLLEKRQEGLRAQDKNWSISHQRSPVTNGS